MASEEVSPEKGLLEKATVIKKFEYLPLGSELKNKIDIAKKEYKGLDLRLLKSNETISKYDKKPALFIIISKSNNW